MIIIKKADRERSAFFTFFLLADKHFHGNFVTIAVFARQKFGNAMQQLNKISNLHYEKERFVIRKYTGFVSSCMYKTLFSIWHKRLFSAY